MKILCETQVVNRLTQTNRTPRPVKATLALGFHTTSKDATGQSTKTLELMHFTSQNKSGARYKLRNNIEKIFTKFVLDGKVTISFCQPPENLMIKCDPIQLKAFLQTLKLGLEGNESTNLRLNIASATAIPQKSQPQQKLAVLKRSDYPTKGFPKTLKALTISGIRLCKVTFEIFSLRHLTMLNLSYNNITKLPPELGRLSLTELQLQSNALGESNAWHWLKERNLQESLTSLDLSANRVTYFPPHLIKMEKLVTLKLNNNTIKSVPFGMRRMRNLRFLHLSTNELKSLPSSFNYARLEVLDVWDNQFLPFVEHQQINVMSAAPSTVSNAIPTPLWILAARAVCEHKLPFSTATLPSLLVDIITESPRCACGKLCYAPTSVLHRAAEATFVNVKNLVFSRERLIYADIVVCGPECAGRWV